jgi:hypothetical protein
MNVNNPPNDINFKGELAGCKYRLVGEQKSAVESNCNIKDCTIACLIIYYLV